MEYEIRFAKENDIPQIMNFIDEHWKKGHILSYNRTLFEWQYRSGNTVNMVLGLNHNELLGLLGYITYNTSDEKDIALALWKALPGNSFLGIKLLMYLIENESHRLVMCPGINLKTTASIYNRMGFDTGTMQQWYRLNSVKSYRIAKVTNREIPSVTQNHYDFVELKTFSDFENKFDFDSDAYRASIPFKSLHYLKWRYFNHPSYHYHKFGIEMNGKVKTLVIVRIQESNESYAVRIVDVIGDAKLLGCFVPFFDAYMQQINAEYIDMYEAGLPDDELEACGWKKVIGSGNIIPNYFTPYLAENIDINYSTSDNHIVIFRGDGDQDRPN